MIQECLREDREFGHIRLLENGIARVGCTAAIIEVVKTHDDGRMDIVTEGRRRFELTEINQERSFFQGMVDFFDDEQSTPPSEDERLRLVELAADIAELVDDDLPRFNPDEEQLSFRIAQSLPLDLDFNLSLLGVRSETERVRALSTFFERALPKVKRVVQAKQKSGGNGHVH
jgi:Lon protease-like protein